MRSDIDWIPTTSPSTTNADESAHSGGDDLGRMLRERGLIEEQVLENANRVQQQSPGRSIARILVDLGVEEDLVMQVVAEQHGIERMRIDADGVDVQLVERLGSEYCRDHLVLPIRREKHRMLVGTADPDAIFLLDEIKARLDARSIRHVLVDAADITRVLDDLAHDLHDDYDVESILADVEDEDFDAVWDSFGEA